MNLILRRISYTKDGIFGNVFDDQNNLVMMSLEHGYEKKGIPKYAPKIPHGTYTCVRGPHKLDGMLAPFETFEVEGVSGHTGLLWHCGNYTTDSSGCILVGTDIKGAMITESRKAFAKFLDLQKDVDSFQLIVK